MRMLPAVVLAILLLSGCVPTPTPNPSPTPTATPVFASEEEALAAAEVAYGEYLAVSDAIAQDGGRDPERLADLVTPEWLVREVSASNDFLATGNRQLGSSTFDGMVLQQLVPLPDGSVELTVYACVDISLTQIVDQTGTDVTPSNRPSIVGVQVAFVATEPRTLLLSNNEPWSGDSFC